MLEFSRTWLKDDCACQSCGRNMSKGQYIHVVSTLNGTEKQEIALVCDPCWNAQVNVRSMDCEQTLRAMFDKVNGGEFRMQDAIAKYMVREHPTLQQAAIRSIVKPILEALATGYTDARNEKAAQWAVAALGATENIGLPTI